MKITKKRLKQIIKEEVARLKNEGRYFRGNPEQSDDPRVKAFTQAIDILDDQVYDSLEGDVAELADKAARALTRAIDALVHRRSKY